MLFRSALIAIFALSALISGSLIPAIDEVIRGIPSLGARNPKNLAGTVSGNASTPRTPGKLRIVENSGVCGWVILFVTHPLAYSLSWKKLRQVSIRLRDMVTLLGIKASGLYSFQVFPRFY
jgi:hypothetical protein